jgi:hypothetical protein
VRKDLQANEYIIVRNLVLLSDAHAFSVGFLAGRISHISPNGRHQMSYIPKQDHDR